MPGRLTDAEWGAFEKLDGSPQKNFEALWRSLIIDNYGGSGIITEYKNHYGVELQLSLQSDVPDLAAAKTVVGWQCKYFEAVRAGKNLGSAQRKTIRDSLKKTEVYHPEISKWILCVPGKLTKQDEDWLYSLASDKLEVCLWNEEDITRLLCLLPNGLYLREAYFGRLRLTDRDLDEAFQLTFAPLEHRWIPEVHVRSDEEQYIRRCLMEPFAWMEVTQAIDALADLRAFFSPQDDAISECVYRSIDDCCLHLKELVHSLEEGDVPDIDSSKQVVLSLLAEIPKKIFALRKKRDVRSLPLFNAKSALKRILDCMYQMEDDSKVPILAVMADAGWGKTHLAASLVRQCEGRRKGGLLLLAKDLGTDDSFSSLVERIVLPGGRRFKNAQEMLAALEEYGNRHRCRVPLVIDGLNESQKPSMWKDILARLEVLLARHQHILLIVTLRTGQCSSWRHSAHEEVVDQKLRTAYRTMCLPRGVQCLEARQFFGSDCQQLAQRYFAYYKIEYNGPIPWILHHPLTLRLFCDATNPKRKTIVRAGMLPKDITSVFELFCDNVAQHLEEKAPDDFQRLASEYRACIRNIGRLLWNNSNRYASVSELKALFPDTSSAWQYDWENILSQEGIILRRPGGTTSSERVFEASYDAFGGFLIADYLTTEFGDVRDCLHFLETNFFIGEHANNKHPLFDDILSFLTWLFPVKYHGVMLCQVVQPSNAEEIFDYTLDCNARFLAPSVLDALRVRALNNIPFARKCFSKVFENAWNADTPLNMGFLDTLLDQWSLVERDQCWGKWLFECEDQMLDLLDWLLQNFLKNAGVPPESIFFACKWNLASVVLPCRDKASRLLMHLGEQYPEKVLDLIARALCNNDPYIVERLTTVAYGILMSLYASQKIGVLRTAGLKYVRQAVDTLLDPKSPHATCNAIIVSAVANTIALFETAIGISPEYSRPFLGNPISATVNPFPAPAQTSQDDRNQVKNAIHMDFENYTLTRVLDLHPYEVQNENYQNMRAQFEQRMYDLGYRFSSFQLADKEIQNRKYDPFPRRRILAFDRFGKKYANIVLHEMQGVLNKQDYTACRLFEDSIDPSFPGKPKALKTDLSVAYFEDPSDIEDWVQKGNIPNLRDFVLQHFADMMPDDWVLLCGTLNQQSQDGKKRLMARIDGFFAAKTTISKLKRHPECLSNLRLPEHYHSYHLEAPWARHYRFDVDNPSKDLSTPHPIVAYCDIPSRRPRGEQTPRFQCELPAEYYGSESRPYDEEDHPWGLLLSHYIALQLNLRPVPHQWDFLDDRGRLAVRCFQHQVNYLGYDLLYLRKDLLEEYSSIAQKQFAMVYQGKRFMEVSEHESHKSFLSSSPQSLGDFCQVFRLSELI